MDELRSSNRLVGVKQSKRAIKDGQVKRAFLALDAEERILQPLRELCAEQSVQVTEVDTMVGLGDACGIEIGAAVAVILN